MNRSKIFSKSAFIFAVAAASALVSSSASAQAPAINAVPAKLTTFVAGNKNYANTCARVYFNGYQYDMNKAKPTVLLRNVPANTSIMASVFKGQKCGGAAVKNVWHKATVSQTAWLIQ